MPRSGHRGPDEQIADALEQSAERARARGGLAAAAALLERSVVLSLDPPRRRKRILAAAAAYLEAGSFDLCASMLTAAEATNLDDMCRAEVDLLRARHAVFSGEIRNAPDLLLRAAKRLEPLDMSRAADAYLAAQAAASVAGTSARGVTIRDVAEAALRCPMPTVRTTREWLVTGLAQVVIDGPAAAALALRPALDVVPEAATAGQAIPWLGYQAGAALALWDDRRRSQPRRPPLRSDTSAWCADDAAGRAEHSGAHLCSRGRPRCRRNIARRSAADHRGDPEQYPPTRWRDARGLARPCGRAGHAQRARREGGQGRQRVRADERAVCHRDLVQWHGALRAS